MSVLLSEARASSRPDLVTAAESAGAQVFVAAQDVFDRMAGYHVHRGALALARRPRLHDAEALLARSPRVLIVEAVNDLENLGSIFRNAAAFGVTAVLLDPSTPDPLYRRSVRVSLGHALRVPFARLEPWPEALRRVGVAGHRLLALSPSGEERLADLDRPERWALMVGSEGDGLSAPALARADATVRIPMAGGVDSLNVATATAVALHHLCGIV